METRLKDVGQQVMTALPFTLQCIDEIVVRDTCTGYVIILYVRMFRFGPAACCFVTTFYGDGNPSKVCCVSSWVLVVAC